MSRASHKSVAGRYAQSQPKGKRKRGQSITFTCRPLIPEWQPSDAVFCDPRQRIGTVVYD